MDPSMLPVRISSKIQIDEVACWMWTGTRTPNGYGQISVKGYTLRVHRHVYELLIEPVPPTLVLDHLCRRKLCCNPAHLEPVTVAENTRRAGHARRGSTCRKGHPYTKANTRIAAGGARICRECQLARGRARERDPETRRRRQERDRIRSKTPEFKKQRNEWARRRRQQRKSGTDQDALF